LNKKIIASFDFLDLPLVCPSRLPCMLLSRINRKPLTMYRLRAIDVHH
jgi:hypothetical protein